MRGLIEILNIASPYVYPRLQAWQPFDLLRSSQPSYKITAGTAGVNTLMLSVLQSKTYRSTADKQNIFGNSEI